MEKSSHSLYKHLLRVDFFVAFPYDRGWQGMAGDGRGDLLPPSKTSHTIAVPAGLSTQ